MKEWTPEEQLNNELPGLNAGSIVIDAIDDIFSVCKVEDYSGIDIDQNFVFTGRTDTEKSLVCPTDIVPDNTISREDGWKGFRICGELDFSLIGILARITKILASSGIGIFVVSTYNTDYIFVKEENYIKAMKALRDSGYSVK